MDSKKEGILKGGMSPPSGMFPEGLRVLVVDDDPTCLRVVKEKLVSCRYEVTTCEHAKVALSMLRERKERFDLVLTDVHMPDMDGFKLLELVGLELDLPVIMMSADTEVKIARKGLEHGACYYLMKPICFNELKNIWQHVVRKKKAKSKETDQAGSVEDSELKKATVEEVECASSVNDGNCNQSKRKKEDAESDDEDEEEENEDSSTQKKQRVVWQTGLHLKFLNAIEKLGFEKAVPKKILELMNVPGLTRENVASHLQKYRLYIRRNMSDTNQFCSNLPSSFSTGPLKSSIESIPPNLMFDFQDQVGGQCKFSHNRNPMVLQPVGTGQMQNIGTPLFVPSINQMQYLNQEAQNNNSCMMARLTYNTPSVVNGPRNLQVESHLQQEMDGNSVGYGLIPNQMRMNPPMPLSTESMQMMHPQQARPLGLVSSGAPLNTLLNMQSCTDLASIGSRSTQTGNPGGNYIGLRMTSSGGLYGLTATAPVGEASNSFNSSNNVKVVTGGDNRDVPNPEFGTSNIGYVNQGPNTSIRFTHTNHQEPMMLANPIQQQNDFTSGVFPEVMTDADNLLSDLLKNSPQFEGVDIEEDLVFKPVQEQGAMEVMDQPEFDISAFRLVDDGKTD